MTERKPIFDLTIYRSPVVKQQLDLYRRTDDEDERARILNERIVQVEDTTATVDSLSTLAMIVAEQSRLIQYRPDGITSLDPDKLVAVVNGLSADEPETVNPLSGALSRIQEAAAQGESTYPLSSRIRDDARADIEDDVLAELAERLLDDKSDFTGRELLIEALDHNVTPKALAKLIKNPATLSALIRSVQEFGNEILRRAIQRQIELIEEDL